MHVGCDNMAVVHALRKRDLTSRSRHVRVHFGFVYDMLDAGDVSLGVDAESRGLDDRWVLRTQAGTGALSRDASP